MNYTGLAKMVLPLILPFAIGGSIMPPEERHQKPALVMQPVETGYKKIGPGYATLGNMTTFNYPSQNTPVYNPAKAVQPVLAQPFQAPIVRTNQGSAGVLRAPDIYSLPGFSRWDAYKGAIGRALQDKRVQPLNVIRHHGNSPEALLAALFSLESGFDQGKIGSSGEIGIGQIMPMKAKECAMTEPDLGIAEQNILCAAVLLAKEMQICRYDVWGAVTNYNMPAAGCDQKRNPHNPGYVDKIRDYYNKWKAVV